MIDIHADDYALTVKTSAGMLELMREGTLDSISIIPNSRCYDECIDMLKQEIGKLPFLPAMSVHLNIVEGLSLSDNEGSLITTTWKSLFFASFIPGYSATVKKRLKTELNAQIKKGWSSVEECIGIAKEQGIFCSQEHLRLDSHQHTHMIPVVRKALSECIKENGYMVEYIRNSKEPLAPFLSCGPLRKSYRFVNLIKNRLLYMLSGALDRSCERGGYSPMYLWGLIMSGKMDADRVSKLYESVRNVAVKDGRDLEILFHPGRMGEDETCPEIPAWAAEDFYLSRNRDIEKAGARKCRELAGEKKL